MSFTQVPLPYRSLFAIPFEDGPPFLPPPLPQLAEELAYWDAEQVAAPPPPPAPSLPAKRFSLPEIMLTHLSRVVSRSEEIGTLTEQQRRIEAERINMWYARSTTWMAFSRMWREAFAGAVDTSSFAEITGPSREEGLERMSDKRGTVSFLPRVYVRNEPGELPDMLADLRELPAPIARYGSEIRKFGLLLRPQLFRSIFEVEPPQEKVQWLEGDTIFIETKTPANPTNYLTDVYHDTYGIGVWNEDFVAARAYLKLGSWPPPW